MALFGLISSVAGFVKVRYLEDKAIIDNAVFRFHYRSTSAIFFVCCIILTANNLIGDPISCINTSKIEEHALNTYCWITATFSLPHQYNKPVGTHVAHPGFGNPTEEDATPAKFHSYYQWVPFMLFFQGILFYVPHWLWKNWEEGKVRIVSDGMRGTAVSTKEQRKDKQARLVRYFIETLHMHNHYAFGYYFCEVLNFINAVGNIYFIDKFLGGSFLTYGTEVISFVQMDQEHRTDPMIQVFPRVTKCTFRKFGPTGTIETHDVLCVLALNILNEKIYIFLWFWLIFLAVCSGLALIYSAAIIILPSVREAILKKRFRFGSPTGVSCLMRKVKMGDFLFLHLLGQNMDLLVFGEVLDELSNRLILNTMLPSTPSSIYPKLTVDELKNENTLFSKEANP